MDYSGVYSSPLGNIVMWSEDGESLGSLLFRDGTAKAKDIEVAEPPLFADVRRWLDIYFSGANPPFTPPLFLRGTDFQKSVWQQVLQIPYGKTATYGEIASRLPGRKASHGLNRAVGGALSRNSIAIIVPCHRVIGKDGSLSGYWWGEERKEALLALERKSALKED